MRRKFLSCWEFYISHKRVSSYNINGNGHKPDIWDVVVGVGRMDNDHTDDNQHSGGISAGVNLP